jgi:hypothetical protein
MKVALAPFIQLTLRDVAGSASGFMLQSVAGT